MQTILKYTFDYILAMFLLPFSAFVLLFAMLWVVTVSPGSPIFIQWRVGLNSKPFRIFKLRTMKRANPNSPTFTLENDNRIILGGNFFRKTRIDELPQLINVLNGTMSLVGPRPEQVHVVQEYIEKLENYNDRHLVKPGITGLSQVEIGYVDDIKGARRKLSTDLEYVNSWSFFGDISICIRTLGVLIGRKGAR